MVEEEELWTGYLEVLSPVEVHPDAGQDERDPSPESDEELEVATSPSSQDEGGDRDEGRAESHPDKDGEEGERCSKQTTRSRRGEARDGIARLSLVIRVFRGSVIHVVQRPFERRMLWPELSSWSEIL